MPTTVVYSDALDGFLEGQDASSSYATAAATASFSDTTAVAIVTGQTFDGVATYLVDQSFLGFDTSVITGAITSAVLSLADASDSSVTDFTIEARLHDWGTSLTTADWVAPASIASKTLLATYTTVTGWTGATYKDFTDVAMVANINQAGFTRVLLNSNRHRTAVTPTGDEFIQAKSADTAGTTSDPKLTIITTSAASAVLSGTVLT